MSHYNFKNIFEVRSTQSNLQGTEGKGKDNDHSHVSWFGNWTRFEKQNSENSLVQVYFDDLEEINKKLCW